MATFEVSVTLIVEAGDDCEAYHMAVAAVDNMICGDILRADMGGVKQIDSEPCHARGRRD